MNSAPVTMAFRPKISQFIILGILLAITMAGFVTGIQSHDWTLTVLSGVFVSLIGSTYVMQTPKLAVTTDGIELHSLLLGKVKRRILFAQVSQVAVITRKNGRSPSHYLYLYSNGQDPGSPFHFRLDDYSRSNVETMAKALIAGCPQARLDSATVSMSSGDFKAAYSEHTA